MLPQRSFLNSYAFVLLPILLALSAALLIAIYGVQAAYFLTGAFAFLSGYAVLTVQRTKRRLSSMEASLQHSAQAVIWTRQEKQSIVERLLKELMDLRNDRAAFLKALTAVYPAGYRQESQIPESTISPNYLMADFLTMQTFLYVDLPQRLLLTGHQLRFAVNADEREIIGNLPEYTGARSVILETESQELLREFLIHGAYPKLKEDYNATGDAEAKA